MAKLVYNAIVCTNDANIGNKGFITYHKINDLIKFKKFISIKYPKWTFANVYDNNTKAKLNMIKP